MNKSKILLFSIFLTTAFSHIITAQNITWTDPAPGVWKCIIGKPDSLSLFSAAGIKPLTEAINKMQNPGFPLPQDLISAEVVNGETYLRFPLAKEEQIYGFGLNFKTVQQRGKILELHVDHYGGTDNGRTHAPVPFYVSDRGYGVFINSSRYLKVYAGTAVRKDSPEAPAPLDRNTDRNWTSQPYSDAVEILVPAAGVEIYLFAGPTPMDAVRRYNLYCGGGCLPPRWGLGFTQRVPALYSSAEVEEEARAFARRGFPLDFIGLEPGWQSKSYPCTFEWDKTRYPDPAAFVSQMKKMRIRLNLWTNPYVSPESPVYKALLPLSATHTVWGGIVPDHSLSEARELFTNQLLKSQVSIGVAGYKLDENDGFDNWLWPDVAKFPSGNSAEQLRQTYGLFLQRCTYEMFRKLNTRTYGLTRASNGGGSSFPYVIYNDYYSHTGFITALINSGFCGVLWTPEVRGSGSGEEWLRRIQTVCFSPMAMINAWADGTKPWTFPEVENEVRYYTTLRIGLIPYLYSEFAKYHFEGTPPFYSMNLEPGFSQENEKKTENESPEQSEYSAALKKEIKDQYMAGEYLLIAPLFAGQNSREVILPKGKWYDFYTGKYAGSAEIITATPDSSRIPVFVKDGGIIPLMPPALHAPAPGEKFDLEIRYYGSAPAEYRLYDDDGESFDYEKGAYSWRTVRVSRDSNNKLIHSISDAEKGKPDNIGKVTWRIMSDK